MTQREAIDKALKKHETNCCMFERGVQTLDDLLASRTVFLGVLQAAQAQAALSKLAAGVSVEPVAWRNPVDSYSLVTTHQKETNEFQYSDEFLAGHTEPLYTAEAIAAARVQENERCVQALEALWHSNDDSTKKCINAIRALIGKEST